MSEETIDICGALASAVFVVFLLLRGVPWLARVVGRALRPLGRFAVGFELAVQTLGAIVALVLFVGLLVAAREGSGSALEALQAKYHQWRGDDTATAYASYASSDAFDDVR